MFYKNIEIQIYSTITLPVVLYGCETWSFTLREKQRLRVFENRVLRRILGPRRDEIPACTEICVHLDDEYFVAFGVVCSRHSTESF